MKKNSIVIFCILSFLSLLNAKEFSNSEIQNIVEDFYYRNNRSLHIWKEARVRIYDIPISVDMNNTYVKGNPQKIYDEKIYLNDILTKQSFLFNVTIPQNEDCYSTMLLLEFEILDVYKGTDFDDTAISEIEVFGEYLNTQD